MSAQDIKISAAAGGTFDCYLALPAAGSAPAVVIMSSIYGVDSDVRQNADDLAAQGFVAAAPDLFWRSDPGPMDRSEEGMRRAKARAANDRPALIEQGLQDLADVIAELKSHPQCNGNIAVVGLCYGGPYAIMGPARLGCAAGFSFHGTKVEDYLDLLDKVKVPLSLHWGDRDHTGPPEVLEAVRQAISSRDNMELHIYPGVGHGYTAPSSDAWNAEIAARSWGRTIEILNGLRTGPAAVNA